MPTFALLMLQAAGAVVGPPPTSGEAAGVSILHPIPSPTCMAEAAEIVVCGKDSDRYRLPGGTSQDPAGPPKAEWRVFGNATAGVGFDQRNIGGYPSNAVMATIKIPF